jgi:hypothetical protein
MSLDCIPYVGDQQWEIGLWCRGRAAPDDDLFACSINFDG